MKVFTKNTGMNVTIILGKYSLTAGNLAFASVLPKNETPTARQVMFSGEKITARLRAPSTQCGWDAPILRDRAEVSQ